MNDYEEINTAKNSYRVQIKSTGQGSDKFGKCEYCAKYVSDVCMLSVKTRYVNGRGGIQWLRNSIVFGHEECLNKMLENLDLYHFSQISQE